MIPEERAKVALAPLINPEPHPLRVDWSDAHSMDLGTLFRRVEAAIEAARLQALEEAAKVAETIGSGPIYRVEGVPHAGVVLGGSHIASAIRDLKTKGE